MKTLSFLPLLFLIFFSERSFSQDCKSSYYFQADKMITFIKYDKDGKNTGKEISTVSDVVTAGSAISSKFHTKKYEADGKLKEEGVANINCDNGFLKIGFQLPGSEDIESVDTYFTYPASMKSGQELQAKAAVRIKTKANGKNVDLYMKVENRKVVGSEKVNTPSGNYDAVKIQFDMTTRFKVKGIGLPKTLKVYEWYSPGVGLVKSEFYNKEGQLQESAVLDSVK